MGFKRRKIEVSPPYVSMADIAFNLVLFFLIMAKTQDDGVQWEPAKATGVKQVASSRVVIAVDKNNKVYLNGNEVSTHGLTALVNKELEEAGSRVVLLKIHKETLASTFDPILEAVSQAGAEAYHVLEEQQ